MAQDTSAPIGWQGAHTAHASSLRKLPRQSRWDPRRLQKAILEVFLTWNEQAQGLSVGFLRPYLHIRDLRGCELHSRLYLRVLLAEASGVIHEKTVDGISGQPSHRPERELCHPKLDRAGISEIEEQLAVAEGVVPGCRLEAGWPLSTYGLVVDAIS